MTKDDVIRMAREAGFERLGTYASFGEDWVAFTESLEAFATLVVAAEREACAEVCEDASGTGQIISCKSAADAIRMRGERHD